jgi:hypothetical protein
MKSTILLSLISTNKGWIVRQALKYVAVGSTALTTWLVAKGYSPDSAMALAAGLTAGISGGLELLLSKLASKIAAQ